MKGMTSVFGKIFCAGVLLACTVRGAAGQVAADAPVLIPRGQQAGMTFSGLVSVRIADVHVSYILERKGDNVTLFGAGVGETSLEITRRGAPKKIFKVFVVPPAASPSHEAQKAAPAAGLRTVTAGVTSPAAPAPHESTVKPSPPPRPTTLKSAESRTPPAPGPGSFAVPPMASARLSSKRDDSGANGAEPSVEKRPGLLFSSRFEVTAETLVSADTETYTPVDAEAVTAQAREDARAGASKERGAVARRQTAVGLRARSIKVRRSSVVVPVTFRYIFSERDSISVMLPLTKRHDQVEVGGETFETSTQGLGDVQLNFTREFPRLRKTAWDGVLALSAGLPTARSIYDVAPGKAPLGNGHAELGNVFGVRRVFDPVVFNAAFGLSYMLPRTVDGEKISPGLGQSFQTGFGYALNDRWVLSEQLYFARRPNYFLNTPTDDRTSSTDQAYLSHSLVLNPKKSGGHTMRLSFNLGLTPGSADYGFGFSYSYRRKSTSP